MATKTAQEYFRIYAKEFATMTDPEMQVWIDAAGFLIYVDRPDDERGNMCLALAAAHMIKLEELYREGKLGPGGGSSSGSSGGGTPGPAGALISEREGDLERKYSDGNTGGSSASSATSTQSSGSAELMDTYYGRMFLKISNAYGGAGIMTGVG